MRIPGRFAYTAETVPKRSRKARREVMSGMMEYEVREVEASDLVADALVVTPHFRRFSPEADGPPRRSYFGYAGGLWTPLHFSESQARGRPPVTRESLTDLLRHPYPLQQVQMLPVGRAYDAAYGPNVLRPGYQIPNEEDYGGHILSTDRLESMERHRAAAEDMILVDDVVYERRYEPCWHHSRVDMGASLSLWSHDNHEPLSHAFRLDRLDDAIEWIGEWGRNRPVRGEIHRIEPAFLRRDDLSHFVNGELDRLLGAELAAVAAFLPEAAVLAWTRLKRGADREGGVRDRGYDGDLDRAVSDLRVLRDGIEAARVPTPLLKERDRVTEKFAALFLRIDFELARRPRPVLDVEEDLALGRLAP